MHILLQPYLSHPIPLMPSSKFVPSTRIAAAASEMYVLSPQVCFADDGEETSESWWEGTLQKKKGDFYFVTFPDSGGSGQSSEVVEKERLRPAHGMAPVKFEKKNFPIDPRIRPDVKATQDSLPKVAKLANLIALNLSQDGASLVAIGPQSTLDTAGALIDMHMMKVPQLAKVAKTANALQGRMMGVQETMNRYSPPSCRAQSPIVFLGSRSTCGHHMHAARRKRSTTTRFHWKELHPREGCASHLCCCLPWQGRHGAVSRRPQQHRHDCRQERCQH